jgi:hypothetical protein
MKAKILFAVLLLFLPIAFAQRYELTNYNATIWQNPYFLNLNIGNKYFFTSTYYLNETRYFLFSYDSYYIRIINRRLDSFGNIEDTRFYAPGISACSNYDFGQDINLWYKDQWLFLFNGLGACNYLSLIKFNVTDYVTNSSSSGLSYFIIATNAVSDGNLFSIGSIMSKGYYTDMVANTSFPIIYQTTDGKIYIAYDFYDLDNAVFTPNNMKTIEISTGMSNVKKLYVIPTNGNCFQWSNCLFHVLYEGNSSQNGNRYGIYVREVHKGFFGYEFADRGIMALTSDSTGFMDYVPGIDKWFYTQAYPYMANKIYYRAIQDNRRIVFVQQYDLPTWVKIDEQNINYHDNNALAPYAINLWNITLIEGGYSSGGSVSTWVNGTKLYKNFYLGGAVYTSANVYYDFQANLTVNIYDYYNGTLIGSATCSALAPRNTYFGTSAFTPCFSRITLPENISLYNISLTFNASGVTWSGGCSRTWANVYHDVIGSPSKFTVTLAPNGVETFAVSPVSEGSSYFMYQVPSETTCICTEWTYKGCYNSTHEYWTRTCSPTGCAAEIRFALNESCAAVITTTTTVGPSPIPGAPPGVGYTGGLFNLTGTAQQLNITGAALVGIAILDRLFSLAGIATFISIAVGAALGYLTKNGHVTAIAILLMIMLFTLLGFYPWWFGIVFIIIAGAILTLMFKGAF